MSARKSVLIIDDDALTLERLREHLEAEGFSVRAANDGEAGLAMIREQRPDLVITDLLLPKLDGFHLASELKRDPDLAEIPLIWITAFYGREEMLQHLHAMLQDDGVLHGTPVLYKPLRTQDLLGHVHSMLEERDRSARPGHVLVVDDDPANLELLERRLEVEDYTTVLVETGNAGIERLQREYFDAVLLDLRLPDIDGLEVLARIRTFNTDVPVIIMTAHGSEAVAVKALTEGASDYLIKPVGRRDLVNALQKSIERTRLKNEKRRVQANLLETMVALNQSKDAVEREHHRMVSLLQSLEEGVVLLDPQGGIEMMNPSALSLLGLSAPLDRLEDLYARCAEVHFETGRVYQGPQLKDLPLKHFTSQEFLVRWSDGREQAFTVTSQPFEVEDGAPSGWILLLQDVTERRHRRLRLEQLLKEQSEALDQANERQAREVAKAAANAERVKNEILAAVSHELRTPLNFIVGFGSILAEGLEGELTPRQQEMVEKMLLGAERLTRTVEDLLDFSMLTTGMLQPYAEPVPLAELAEDMVAACEQEARSRKLDLRMAPDPAPVQPTGDVSFTCKILRQLLSNALKFTPEGGRVRLAVKASPSEASLEVSDTGIGIEPGVLPNIFNRFYQGESQTTRRFGGTGMGLALAKGLAELMGARIEVESAPKHGSTFRIVWPLLATE